MNVRRNEPQEKLQVSLDEVQDDLVVVVDVVHLGNFGSRGGSKSNIS